MMQVYISGKSTEVDRNKEYVNFINAKSLLESMNMQVINGFCVNPTIEKHLKTFIDSLSSMEAIFMLKRWNESKISRIEKYIAEEHGKIILFESIFEKDVVKRIKEVITEVTGLKFQDYTIKSRKMSLYYVRMIFVNYCVRNKKIHPSEIAKMVNRDYTTVHHYLIKYKEELQFNKEFRAIVRDVEEVLGERVSH